MIESRVMVNHTPVRAVRVAVRGARLLRRCRRAGGICGLLRHELHVRERRALHLPWRGRWISLRRCLRGRRVHRGRLRRVGLELPSRADQDQQLSCRNLLWRARRLLHRSQVRLGRVDVRVDSQSVSVTAATGLPPGLHTGRTLRTKPGALLGHDVQSRSF